MPHAVMKWKEVDRYDLHAFLHFCVIRTYAKVHISHEGVVRLITARESGWEVEVLTTSFLQSKHAYSSLHSSTR